MAIKMGARRVFAVANANVVNLLEFGLSIQHHLLRECAVRVSGVVGYFSGLC